MKAVELHNVEEPRTYFEAVSSSLYSYLSASSLLGGVTGASGASSAASASGAPSSIMGGGGSATSGGTTTSLSAVRPKSSSDVDVVLSCHFDVCPDGCLASSHLCLIIMYTTGFQVWDIDNLSNIQELFSKREAAIKCAKFLPSPKETETVQSPFFQSRPLLALVAGENTQNISKNKLRIFSLKQNDVVNVITFNSDIYNLYPSSRIFLVALKDRIFGFNPCSLEKEFTLETYPSPFLDQVVALSSRWLAFAGNSPVQYEVKPDKGTLVRVAREVVRGASFLGDLAGKSASSLLGYTPTENTDSIQSFVEVAASTANEHAGSVIVHDVCARRTISQFYAHALPLAVLTWDLSGTLLVTADIECRSFHVYKFSRSSAEISKPQFIYTLRRGVTAAVVQDISFSPDGRWVSASSTHGTSHIFGVYPAGGPVNVYTHVPEHVSNRPPDTLGYANTFKVPHVEVGSLSKIRHISGRPQPEMAARVKFLHTDYTPKSGRPITSKSVSVLVSTDGILSLLVLNPHGPNSPDIEKSQLELSLTRVTQWDVCRKASAPDYVSPSFQTVSPSIPRDAIWLSNIEITCHSDIFKFTWAIPKYTFCTFKSTDSCDESTPNDPVVVIRETPAAFHEGPESVHLFFPKVTGKIPSTSNTIDLRGTIQAALQSSVLKSQLDESRQNAAPPNTLNTIPVDPDSTPPFAFTSNSTPTNIMLPGVASGFHDENNHLLSWNLGDTRSVILHPSSPVMCVGTLVCQKIDVAQKRGKCLQVLHSYKDHLWATGSKTDAPDHPLRDTSSTNPQCTSPSTSPALESPERACSPLSTSSQSSFGEVDQADLDSTEHTTSASPTPTATTTTTTSTSPTCNLDEQAISIITIALSKVPDDSLPILASKFHATYLSSSIPPGVTLDLTKTSFKKLSQLLKHMCTKGFLSLMTDPHGTLFIMAVDRSKLKEVGTPQVEEAAPKEVQPIAEQVYTLPSALLTWFHQFGLSASKVDPVRKSQIRDAINAWISRQHKGESPPFVLGPALGAALSTNPHTAVDLDELESMILKKLQPCVLINRPGIPASRRLSPGKIKTITISTARSKGYRFVTLVTNLDSFGYELEALVPTFQAHFAASCVIQEADDGSSVLSVQGKNVNKMVEFLVEHLRIPRDSITINSE
ncbi:hypothetical protein Pelo_14036 [Pelomyxa schiedti]|nr:hypothetical protein Pelo_14036 [Pelomyxa schiedti]